MAQFDLVALSSIALFVLALYEVYRNWNRKGQSLSFVLLALAALQAAWLLQFLPPWGSLDLKSWTAVSAGMIACVALGLSSLRLSNASTGSRPEAVLPTVFVLILSLWQLLHVSGILNGSPA